MMFLASSIATSAVRPSGRSAASLSGRVLTFRCVIVQLSVVVVGFFFFQAQCPLSTEDVVEQRDPW